MFTAHVHSLGVVGASVEGVVSVVVEFSKYLYFLYSSLQKTHLYYTLLSGSNTVNTATMLQQFVEMSARRMMKNTAGFVHTLLRDLNADIEMHF